MYGSILTMVTLRLRLSNNAPIEADARPLPSDDTTPPVTNMNFVFRAFFSAAFSAFAIVTSPSAVRGPQLLFLPRHPTPDTRPQFSRQILSPARDRRAYRPRSKTPPPRSP